MAITTTSSSAPADEPVGGYRCLVSGTQTGFAAGAFRGAAWERGFATPDFGSVLKRGTRMSPLLVLKRWFCYG